MTAEQYAACGVNSAFASTDGNCFRCLPQISACPLVIPKVSLVNLGWAHRGSPRYIFNSNEMG